MSAEKKQALRHVRRTSTAAKLASERRDAAIHHALDSSSIREVAEAASLSPARVHQIRHGK